MALKKSYLLWPAAVVVYLPLVVGFVVSEDTARSTGAGTSGETASSAVTVSGSSTVEPISIAVAEQFATVSPGSRVDVDGPGTGDGFELFCDGETDINDASRPIQAEEIAACGDNDIDFVEVPVAIDGLSVLTNSANEAVDCLGFADLYALVGPESQGVDNWAGAQALASELGSNTALPDRTLAITGPGEESGTYDSFVELALGDLAAARLEAGAITEDQEATTRPDYTSQADDNAILAGIEGSNGSLGWVGFAFAEDAGDEVEEVAVDGGEGCVAPTSETIADGSYPLSRTLYLYVSTEAAGRPEVDRYVDYYLRGGIAAVEDVGYVALSGSDLSDSLAAWDARETGTRVEP